MHDGIDHSASFRQCLCNRGADQLLDFTWVTEPGAGVQRLRQLADRLCKPRFRFSELRSYPGNHDVIEIEAAVHQFADRVTTQQFFRMSIEQQIDAAHVNSEVVRLREEYPIR